MTSQLPSQPPTDAGQSAPSDTSPTAFREELGVPTAGNIHPTRMRYTDRASRAFDRTCQLTNLSNSELCRRFSRHLGRDRLLSRQTLAAWRSGERAVPLSAFIAAASMAGLRLRVIFALGEEGFDISTIPPEVRVEPDDSATTG